VSVLPDHTHAVDEGTDGVGLVADIHAEGRAGGGCRRLSVTVVLALLRGVGSAGGRDGNSGGGRVWRGVKAGGSNGARAKAAAGGRCNCPGNCCAGGAVDGGGELLR